jgi:predicted SAM-dependent methyltransferase
MIKLDIGSGGKSSDDSFISVDPYVKSADIQADMWDLPFEDGTVDVIWASQSLEHISKYKVFPTLLEFKRVLKIGGKLQILVPDLEWVCTWWLKHPSSGWALDIIFGNQKHDGEYHKTGFNFSIMRDYIEDIPGLKIVKVEYLGMSLQEIDKKYENGDRVEQRSINFEILRVDDESTD